MGENYFGITNPGRQRKNNEDSFIAETVFNGQYIVACVIDGVGGYAGGEIAAQITRDAIVEQFQNPVGNIEQEMISAFENANEGIVREKEVNPQNENMACVVTLAVIDIEKNKLYYAHVGDTRLYLFRDGSLVKITRDHSNVGFLEESGRLTEIAAMQHPKRNEVNKALGYGMESGLGKDFIDTGESPFLPGDVVLVCSDGLTDMIPAGKIISILNIANDLPEKGRLLIDAANEAGGKDNITVVLARNDKSPVEHSITKPLSAQKKNDRKDAGTSPQEEKDNGEQAQTKNTKGNCGLISFLLVIAAIMIAAFAWNFYDNLITSRQREKDQLSILPKTKNLAEVQLADRINNSAANASVTLTPGQPILITDSLFINKDSLHIIGNGVSFVRDSAYTGPAFTLASSCKNILLDSLIIENFDVGILVLNKGLHLKNVQFKNCKVPVAFHPPFLQNVAVSGLQADTIFYYSDSLHK